MIKANITKNNIVTNSAAFETQELAEAWVAQEVANGSFGKNQRWLNANEVSSEGLDVNDALATREVGEGENAYTEYEFAAEYTVAYEDVTTEKAKADELLQRQKDIALGVSVLNEILSIGNSKNLSNAVVDAFYDSALFLRIDRMLKNGSLEHAKRNIQDGDVSALLTSEEKAALLAKLP